VEELGTLCQLGSRLQGHPDRLKTPGVEMTAGFLGHDISMIEKYWGSERTYHHTAPISMNYALREALQLVYHEHSRTRTWRSIR